MFFAPAQELSGINSDMNIVSAVAVMSSELKLRRAQSLGSIKTVNYAVYF